MDDNSFSDLNRLKALFTLDEIKLDSDESGRFGEALAKSWLKDDSWRLLDINLEDEDIFTNELYKDGGKKTGFHRAGR